MRFTMKICALRYKALNSLNFYEIMTMIRVVRKAPEAASSGWRTHGFGLYVKEDDDYD